MATKPESKPQDIRHWGRVLRPLVWWLMLVLILYGIRIHQRLMAETRLVFEVSLAGKSAEGEASAKLDGRTIFPGEHISLGNHTFTVTHPKGESYSTDLFIWYGVQDLGTIELKRAMGTLALDVSLTAQRIMIHGSEFSVVLTNSMGLTSSVPTGSYFVEAQFKQLPIKTMCDFHLGIPIQTRDPELRRTLKCLECSHASGRDFVRLTFPFAIANHLPTANERQIDCDTPFPARP